MTSQAMHLPDAIDIDVMNVRRAREFEACNRLLGRHRDLEAFYQEPGFLFFRSVLDLQLVTRARDALHDWSGDVPMQVHIEHVGPEPAGPLALSEADMGCRLRAAGRLVTFAVEAFQNLSASIVQAAGGRNRFMMQPMQFLKSVRPRVTANDGWLCSFGVAHDL